MTLARFNILNSRTRYYSLLFVTFDGLTNHCSGFGGVSSMIQRRIYGLDSGITRYAQPATYFTKMCRNVTISGVVFGKVNKTKNGDLFTVSCFVDQTSKLK